MHGTFQQQRFVGRSTFAKAPKFRSLVRPCAAYQTMRSAPASVAAVDAPPNVVVVTIPACPYCRRAKAALNEAEIPFVELDASIDTQLRSIVRQVAGKSSVPQVFVGGRSFGGSDDLAAGLESGTFQSALSHATASGIPALPQELAQRLEQLAAERQAAAEMAAARAAEAAAAAAAASAAIAAAAGSASHWSVSDSGAEEERELMRQNQDPNIQIMRLQGVLELIADPTAGIERKTRTVWGRSQKVFSGQAFLDWISGAGLNLTPATYASRNTSAARQWLALNCISPTGAAEAASQLLVSNYITLATDKLPPAAKLDAQGQPMAPQVDPKALYVVVPGAAAPLRGQPLNTFYWWNGQARPAGQVAQDLRELIMQLYDRHLSSDGRSVNYAGIREDPLFGQYVGAAAELQRVDLGPLSREELCALFINLYNALIIHAMVVYGPPANTAQRMTFFTKDASYCIAGHTYTADDIENGVLRGNRPAASNLFVLVGLNKVAGGQFKKDEPRAKKVVIPMDPRIHFALVCGAKSCPPISIYTPDNLEEGLTAAGEVFCSSEVEVDAAQGVVKLSKIMQWYSMDFGENDTEKLRFVLQFLKGKKRSDLEGLLASGKSIKIKYKEYDWSLNN